MLGQVLAEGHVFIGVRWYQKFQLQFSSIHYYSMLNSRDGDGAGAGLLSLPHHSNLSSYSTVPPPLFFPRRTPHHTQGYEKKR